MAARKDRLKEDNLASSPSVEGEKRILVIEDDPMVSQSIRNLLEKEGYNAVVAPVGLAAMDFAADETFVLIISDIRMPGMNGIKTLKAIRELRREFQKPPIPEIILTAYDDAEIRKEALGMGVCEFMLKPFDADELLKTVKKYISRTEVS
jgi:DNA-binding response OmpR family regulator